MSRGLTDAQDAGDRTRNTRPPFSQGVERRQRGAVTPTVQGIERSDEGQAASSSPALCWQASMTQRASTQQPASTATPKREPAAFAWRLPKPTRSACQGSPYHHRSGRKTPQRAPCGSRRSTSRATAGHRRKPVAAPCDKLADPRCQRMCRPGPTRRRASGRRRTRAHGDAVGTQLLCRRRWSSVASPH